MIPSSSVKGDRLSVIFESSPVEVFASSLEWGLSAEASVFHVLWLVNCELLKKSSVALSHFSLMERFWLVVLFPVLRSLLVCVEVRIGRPASRVP